MSPRERIALERHNKRVLARHIDELKPDVVNWWAMGGMSLSLIEQVRRAGVPAVGVVGDDWMDYGRRVDGWQRLAARIGPFGPLLGRVVGVPAGVDMRDTTWLFNSARHPRQGGPGHRLPAAASPDRPPRGRRFAVHAGRAPRVGLAAVARRAPG